MKGWTSSSKKLESHPEPINTKEEIILEDMKRKVERADLKWDDLMLQEKLKYSMYVERSLRDDPKKEKLIDELNFKNFMCFKIKTTLKYFVGIKVKGRKFIIHSEYSDSKNIFSHPFLQNFKHRPNVVQYLSKLAKKALKRQISENSVEHKVHQIQPIIGSNGKTDYRGWAYVKNEVILEPG